jgi:hypothetical protein
MGDGIFLALQGKNNMLFYLCPGHRTFFGSGHIASAWLLVSVSKAKAGGYEIQTLFQGKYER